MTEPLPREGAPPGAASLRRFEPESLLIDVEAKVDALLVLAEAWYPGWRAEIDGRAGACVAANIWMRAVPIPAGRHQVRLYFHQDYLLPGLLLSLASAGLWLAIFLPKSSRPANFGPAQQEGIDAPTAASTAEHGASKPKGRSHPARSRALPIRGQLLWSLLAGALLVWLVAMTGTLRVRSCNRAASNCEAAIHFRIAATFAILGKTGQAITHFTEGLRLEPDSAEALDQLAWIRSCLQTEFYDGPEAVRLAERACQLTDYKQPPYVGTLAEALNNLACTRTASPQAEQRDLPGAVRLAERACQLTGYRDPKLVGTLALTLNNLAWLRAASPRAELRDGPEAVRLAERACTLTGYKMPMPVATLAAAYAEAGRFDEAVTTAGRARELASARGDRGLAEGILKFIEIYKAHQPARDPDLRDAPLRVGPRP